MCPCPALLTRGCFIYLSSSQDFNDPALLDGIDPTYSARVAELCVAMSDTYISEAERTTQLTTRLQTLLGLTSMLGPLTATTLIGNNKKPECDAGLAPGLVVFNNVLQALLVDFQGKNGQAGDPGLHNLQFYALWWYDDAREPLSSVQFVNVSHCPSFSVQVAGPFIGVSGEHACLSRWVLLQLAALLIVLSLSLSLLVMCSLPCELPITTSLHGKAMRAWLDRVRQSVDSVAPLSLSSSLWVPSRLLSFVFVLLLPSLIFLRQRAHT